MAETRRRFNHDMPSRFGAKNTIMYHQILAFLPEEADMNGGILTPEKCMEYAHQYAARKYPNHEIIFALHREYCAEDQTERYAVHMGINRTDLETGLRLWDGTPAQAKKARLEVVRALDGEWGLQQLEKDVPNSKIHKKQLSGVARGRQKEGRDSTTQTIRETSNRIRNLATSKKDYFDRMKAEGINAEIKNGVVYASVEGAKPYHFNLTKLDFDNAPNQLEKIFLRNRKNKEIQQLEAQFASSVHGKSQSPDQCKQDYVQLIANRVKLYCEEVKAYEGKPIRKIPRLRVPKPPEEIYHDPEIQSMLLREVREADKLRSSLSSTKKASGNGTGNVKTSSRQWQVNQPRSVPERNRGNDVR